MLPRNTLGGLPGVRSYSVQELTRKVRRRAFQPCGTHPAALGSRFQCPTCGWVTGAGPRPARSRYHVLRSESMVFECPWRRLFSSLWRRVGALGGWCAVLPIGSDRLPWWSAMQPRSGRSDALESGLCVERIFPSFCLSFYRLAAASRCPARSGGCA